MFRIREQAEQLSANVPRQADADGDSRTLYASKAYYQRKTTLVERVGKYRAHNTG